MLSQYQGVFLKHAEPIPRSVSDFHAIVNDSLNDSKTRAQAFFKELCRQDIHELMQSSLLL